MPPRLDPVEGVSGTASNMGRYVNCAARSVKSAPSATSQTSMPAVVAAVRRHEGDGAGVVEGGRHELLVGGHRPRWWSCTCSRDALAKLEPVRFTVVPPEEAAKAGSTAIAAWAWSACTATGVVDEPLRFNDTATAAKPGFCGGVVHITASWRATCRQRWRVAEAAAELGHGHEARVEHRHGGARRKRNLRNRRMCRRMTAASLRWRRCE